VDLAVAFGFKEPHAVGDIGWVGRLFVLRRSRRYERQRQGSSRRKKGTPMIHVRII
jgi:hypothetical protein